MRYIITFFVCYSVCLTIALLLLNQTPMQSIIYAAVTSLVVAVSLRLVQGKHQAKQPGN